MRKYIGHLVSFLKMRRNPVHYARNTGVKIGVGCRLIDFKSGTFGSEPFLIELGDNVTIASGVRFVTHDGGVAVLRSILPNVDFVAPIRIGSNVFIGINSTILPGVTIGDNCIIGACSLVTKDVAANTVAVGSPARPLKSIDEYKNSIEADCVVTKNLSKEDKRELLICHAKHYWERKKVSN